MKTISAASLAWLLAAGAPGADFPPLVLPEGAGVNIHFTRGHERDLDLIAAAGFKFIRMDFGWGGIERKRGEYDWAAYDELTANLEKRGLRAIYLLDYSNGLYEDSIVSRDPVSGQDRRDTASPAKPESVEAFARWAGAAAARFKGRRVIWEIWNEPNIGFWKPKPNVKDYIALVQATTKAVREADPVATIVAPASSGFPWPFFEELLAAPGVLASLDGVSVHPYRSQAPETAAADYAQLRATIERLAPALRRSIPLLSGEWGYPTHSKGLSLEQQAAYLARQQLHNLLCGVPISIWYDWKNDGLDPAYNEHNFGTVSNNLALKPSYLAMQTLARQLAGCRIARRLPTDSRDDFALLIVNRAGDQKVAAWTTGQPHPLPVELGVKASDIAAVDGQGRPLTLSGQGSAVTLALDAAPQYLSLKKPSRLLALQAAWQLDVPPPVLVEGGSTAGVALPVRVANPFSAPLQAGLSLRWASGSVVTNFTLGAGATAVTSLQFQPQHRSPETIEAILEAVFRDASSDRTAAPGVRSAETLSFRLSNPLQAVLAPGGAGVLLVVRNPSASRFDGAAEVNGRRLPLRIEPATREAFLEAPAPADRLRAAAQLFSADGKSVSERITARFQPLASVPFKSHLDGDSKIRASASLMETEAPLGEPRPFPKAWRLDYDFESGWRFVRCAAAAPNPIPVPEGTRALGLWVHGDNSGNLLRMRVTDAGGQTFQPNGPALDWTGWRWVTFDLEDLRHAGHWGGANDGIRHGALRLDCPLLLDGSSRRTRGSIHFAGLVFIAESGGASAQP